MVLTGNLSSYFIVNIALKTFTFLHNCVVVNHGLMKNVTALERIRSIILTSDLPTNDNIQFYAI